MNRMNAVKEIFASAQSPGRLDETLVFDIGVNAGEDTSYYLQKGFRVVGVEANPRIFAQLQVTFAQAISEGRLTLLNIGIWNQPTTLPFYINLHNDHWSSFDPVYGCRNNTRYDVIDVPCIGIRALFEQHGIPRYMKVDIEGGDKLVLADLPGLPCLPPFISVEEFGNNTIPELFKAGYRKFKVVPQLHKQLMPAGTIQLEGLHVEKSFHGTDSGPFGLDLAGDWLNYDQALADFRQRVRNEAGKGIGPPNEWFDVHAAVSDEAMASSSQVQWLWTTIRNLPSAHDDQVRDYEGRLAENAVRISELTAKLDDAEHMIGTLRQRVEEEGRVRRDSDGLLASARKEVNEERQARESLEQRARAQQQIIGDQARQLDQTRAELDAIVTSRTWRMLAPYRSIRRRLSAR
ncbi:hypothetical protein BSCH_01921c [Candidatus Paraburkholderia schumanniana]|nr:hypothetical protein BSCH_01921c [Candidatus Paraburkholderia schumannianae]